MGYRYQIFDKNLVKQGFNEGEPEGRSKPPIIMSGFGIDIMHPSTTYSPGTSVSNISQRVCGFYGPLYRIPSDVWDSDRRCDSNFSCRYWNSARLCSARRSFSSRSNLASYSSSVSFRGSREGVALFALAICQLDQPSISSSPSDLFWGVWPHLPRGGTRPGPLRSTACSIMRSVIARVCVRIGCDRG